MASKLHLPPLTMALPSCKVPLGPTTLTAITVPSAESEVPLMTKV